MIFRTVVLSVLCLSHPWAWAGTVGEIAEQMDTSVADFKRELYRIQVECEYDKLCMTEKIEQKAQNHMADENNMWSDALSKINKDEIKSSQHQCKDEDLTAVNNYKARCMKNPRTSSDCINRMMIPLAERGNLYAMLAIANSNSPNAQYWRRKLESHQDTLAYDMAVQCGLDSQNFMIDLMPTNPP